MFLSSLILSLLLTREGFGLLVTNGSPCQSSCHTTSFNTTPDAIVCQDQEYNSPPGTYFQECVKCELRSTFFRPRSFETYDTDVKWGLYNLRYLLSACIFNFPEKKADSVSSPCQVTCDPLGEAIRHLLLSPTPENMLDFCGMGVFDDGVITQCAACYNLTETQKYLGNFVESIREGCHAHLPNGVPFVLDPNKIFDTEPLPPNTDVPKINAPGTAKKNIKNLILVIVLPIVGFLLLAACACGACVFCIQRRRRKAKRRSQPSYLHERWNDTGIMSPVHSHLRRSWGEPSPYQPEFTGPYAEYPNQTHMSAFGTPQDMKYPPETHAMESTSPQFATVSPKSVMETPKLFPAPPPRKSMND
ncbi:GlgB 1,4-alpha-glucan branching enzyme domain [Histoplasma ohiense]|nr:GlgB 1,4-alpha-glucan branching enzyme domain [Histoplasma ohiense (nom. inval.)]